jgi:vitamin B12 transporter
MSDYKISLAALAAASAFAFAAHAEEAAEVDALVVTASRAGPVPADRVGGAVTVVEALRMQDRQVRLVADVLRDVPGVSVSRSGPGGSQVQVRLRGAEANQSLVMIDGIEASDPAQGEFDFATLIADDVARVEVLRGHQSALYGSDAIGGVIAYSTADGRQAPGLRGSAEWGAQQTARASARFGGVAGPFDYALSGTYSDTDGVVGVPGGNRELAAENHALAGKFGFDPAAGFRLKAALRYASTDADTNDFDYNWPPGPTYGLPIDGTNFYSVIARMGLVRGEFDLADGAWTHALTAQANDTRRRNYYAPGLRSSATDARRTKLSYETTWKASAGGVDHVLTGALDAKRERFQTLPEGVVLPANQKRRIDNLGLVAQYDAYVGERGVIGLALRHDDNDRFDSATTFRLQGSWRLAEAWRLRAAAGSGIKNPNPIELFGYDPRTFIGNPNLKPERSIGGEIGVERRFQSGLGVGKASLTLFGATLQDEIYTTFSPTFVSGVANRDTDSRRQGLEAEGSFAFGPAWTLDGAYTWTDSEENGVREIRRPEHVASLNLTWRAPDRPYDATLTVRYNGAAEDTFFGLTSETKRLDAYTVVNFNADWAIAEGVTLYGRVENLGDAQMIDVYGYASAGRTAMIGLRAGF